MTKAALVLLAVAPLRAVPVPQVADGVEASSRTFEVASVKPNRSGGTDIRWTFANGRFTDVVFGEHDVVEPDLLYIDATRREEILTKLHVRGVPDLVIEVGSPGTRKRDETIKRRLYERTGVREYWVVDPDLEVIRVYRRDGDRYGRPTELAREAGDVLTSVVIAGFELPLAEVFRMPSSPRSA